MKKYPKSLIIAPTEYDNISVFKIINERTHLIDRKRTPYRRTEEHTLATSEIFQQ